jgi:hypothetical protein
VGRGSGNGVASWTQCLFYLAQFEKKGTMNSL